MATAEREHANRARTLVDVFGASIDALDWATAMSRLAAWAETGESRYICICNVHSIVTARKDPAFARVVNESDMSTPDGAPIAWFMRREGYRHQQRINGPDFMWRYCEFAAQAGQGVYLYGSTDKTLERLQSALLQAFPSLHIVGSYSPPFRTLTPEEDLQIVERINASVVWVSLGCPKQETWMAAHRGRVKGVMVGVGAAFDYHAGLTKRAPNWMRDMGLEWVHRLASEPRRLFRRYLETNTFFLKLIFAHELKRLFSRK